jgi:PKD repeat protein
MIYYCNIINILKVQLISKIKNLYSVKRSFTKLLPVSLLAIAALFYSCDETDPLPISEAKFEINTMAPEVGLPVIFENQSLNSSLYAWDFGDGNTDSLTVAPEHTYETPGTYMVTLKAYTEDGQSSQESKELTVGERFLTGMYIVSIDMEDPEGNPWDADGSGPDVLFQLGPTDATVLEDLAFVFIDSLNVGQFSTPIGITTDDILQDDFKLQNKDFFILLEEIDTVNNEAQFTPMVELTFNPIVQEDEFITVTKRADGTGDIVIPFIVLQKFQFFLEFIIR